MMNLLRISVFITAFLLSGLAFSLYCNVYSAESNVHARLKQAEGNFTLDGKPIHPGCVREFNVGLADSPPPVVRSVDVEACISSNENYLEFKTSGSGYVSYEYDLGEGEKGYFAYKYLGKTQDGLHVLDTRSNTDGTMVAMTVFLVDFGIEKYTFFTEENEKKTEKRLVMSCTGQITRGDRDTGKIELKGNKLVLGASQYREKEEVIPLD